MENRYTQLHVDESPSISEYATTLSVLTFFCLSMFALAVAVGYVT